MKKIYLPLVLLLATAYANAQSIYQKTFGDVFFDNATSVVRTTGDGYVLIGNTGSGDPDSSDVAAYLLSQHGDLIWSSKIGDYRDDIVTDITNTDDDGYMLVGSSRSSLNDTLNHDIFAMMLDSSGFQLWSLFFGDSGDDLANAVIRTDDGGFLICGSTTGFGLTQKSGLVIKLNEFGSSEWTHLTQSLQLNSYAHVESVPGGYILAGTTADSGGTSDHLVTLLDTAGAIIWSKRFGTIDSDSLFDISATSDGGYIAAGVSYSNTAGDADMNIFKLDSAGNIEWNNNYGVTEYDRGTSVMENAAGNYIFTGTSNAGTSVTVINQLVIGEMDNTGGIIWANSFGDLIGSTEPTALVNGSDGGYFVAGWTNAFSDPNGDAIVVKINETGNSGCFQNVYSPVTISNVFTDSTGANEQMVAVNEIFTNFNHLPFINQFGQNCFNSRIDEISLTGFEVYPNPANVSFRVSFNADRADELIIFDQLGNEVIRRVNVFSGETIDVSELPAGIYHARLSMYNKLSSLRLVVSK